MLVRRNTTRPIAGCPQAPLAGGKRVGHIRRLLHSIIGRLREQSPRRGYNGVTYIWLFAQPQQGMQLMPKRDATGLRFRRRGTQRHASQCRSNQRRISRRRPVLEQLENRELLASNITVGADESWSLSTYSRVVNGNEVLYSPLVDYAGVPASVLKADLAAGFDIRVVTDNPTGTQPGNVKVEGFSGGASPNRVQVTIQADGNIVFGTGHMVAPQNHPMDLTLNADRDGDGSGRIWIPHTVRIDTGGGDLVMGGGSDPLNLPAVGTADHPIGVYISGDIRTGGGQLRVRGRGASVDYGHGIVTDGEYFGIGDVTLVGDGGSSTGTGVSMGAAFFRLAPDAHVDVTGTAGSAAGAGVVLNNFGHLFNFDTGGSVSIASLLGEVRSPFSAVHGNMPIIISETTQISGRFTLGEQVSSTSFTLFETQLSFAPGSVLDLDIEGTTPATDHDQIRIAGTIDLSGSQLQLAGTYDVQVGDQFVIIDNDGTEPISGTFDGLAEGAQVSNDFLGSGLPAFITYRGHDGNDVVIEVGQTLVSVSRGDLLIQDVGGAQNDELAILLDGPHYRIRDAANKLTPGPGVVADGPDVLVVAADVTGSILVETGGGADQLTVDFAGGEPIPAGGLQWDAGADDDRLNVLGGLTAAAVRHRLTDPTTGSMDIDSAGDGSFVSRIQYSELESVMDRANANRRLFDLDGTSNAAVLDDDGTVGDSISELRSSILFGFDNPAQTLVLQTDAGQQRIDVRGVDPGGTLTDLEIVTGAGDDEITLGPGLAGSGITTLNLDGQSGSDRLRLTTTSEVDFSAAAIQGSGQPQILLTTPFEDIDASSASSVNVQGDDTDQSFDIRFDLPNAGVFTLPGSQVHFGSAPIVINAGGGDDSLLIDNDSGNTPNAITFHGQSGNDTMTLMGMATMVEYQVASSSDGTILVDGVPVQYTGLGPITDNLVSGSIDYNIHRSDDPMDTSGDGFLSALDALLVINLINRNFQVSLASIRTIPGIAPDTSADDQLTPIDALMVINRINLVRGEGEGQSFHQQATDEVWGHVWDFDDWHQKRLRSLVQARPI